MYLTKYLPLYLPSLSPINPSNSTSIHKSVCLYIHQSSIHPTFHPPTHSSIHPSIIICLSVYLSVCLSVYPSAHNSRTAARFLILKSSSILRCLDCQMVTDVSEDPNTSIFRVKHSMKKNVVISVYCVVYQIRLQC